MKKPILKPALLILSSLFITLLVCEIGYRLYRSQQLSTGQFRFLMVEEPIYQFDTSSGYRYSPNKSLTARWVEENDSIYKSNSLHFNSMNQRSNFDFSPNKPKDTFRIVVVGDSLSACIHNNLPWPDALHEQLQTHSPFKKKVGKAKVEVINLARDGIGLEQFPALIKNEALPLKPDLILVNFITADIYRRFIWRKSIRLEKSKYPFEVVLNCTTLPAEISNPNCFFAGIISMKEKIFNDPIALKAVRETIAKEVTAKINWFSLYPEFLSFVLKGKLEQFLDKVPYAPKSPTYETRETSLIASSQALNSISTLNIPTLYLHLPVYWEMLYRQVPKFTTDLMARTPNISIIPMIDYLPDHYSREDVEKWTNHPHDMHLSDEGSRLYAQMVLKMLDGKFKETYKLEAQL